MTEKDALKKLKNGEEAGLEWFISAYSGYVSAIIHNIIGEFMGLNDVEEAASDVFVALWENREKVFFVKGYLAAVARNTAKNKLRSAGNDLSLEEDLVGETAPGADEVAQKRDLSRAVQRAVRDMEWPDREIFLRYYYYCQDQQTIAQEMDMNLSTVKTRLRRGRQRLKPLLEDYIT